METYHAAPKSGERQIKDQRRQARDESRTNKIRRGTSRRRTKPGERRVEDQRNQARDESKTNKARRETSQRRGGNGQIEDKVEEVIEKVSETVGGKLIEKKKGLGEG